MSKRIIAFCAAMPPPLHGQSFITAKLHAALEEAGANIVILNISPNTLLKGLTYHFRRLLRVLFACVRLIVLRIAHPFQDLIFYGIVESHHGIVYNYILLSVARLCGYEVFLHHHTARHTKSYQAGFAGLVKLVPDATHIVLSHDMSRDLKALYSKIDKVIVSGNTCHLELPVAIDRKKKKEPLHVGMLSNLTVEKGVILALESTYSAVKSGLDVELILAGPVVDQEVVDAIDRYKILLGDRLIMRGPLYGADKFSFLSELDIFLFPTQYANEAQPLVLLEAMSQGCMVIAYGRGYIPEVLGDAGYCLPIDTDYVKEATQILKSLNSDFILNQNDKSIEQYNKLRTIAALQFKNLLNRMID